MEKTHWGTDEEIEPFFEDGYVVDGVRLSWRPRVLCTPRPYLEDNLGRWRKTYIQIVGVRSEKTMAVKDVLHIIIVQLSEEWYEDKTCKLYA